MDKRFSCQVDLLLYSPNLTQKSIDILENSNKVILNPEILNKLSKELDEIESPMIFKITNNTVFGLYECFVGVHDFSATSNKIYLSNKIADDLFAERNSIIDIQYYVPPKGSYVKFKPKTEEFYNIQEVKYILEKNIVDNYPVLQKGRTISLKYFDSQIELLVEDCAPFDVISTTNTDIEVDFSPIQKPKSEPEQEEEQEQEFINQTQNSISINETYFTNEMETEPVFTGLKLSEKNNEQAEKDALLSTNPRIRAFMERKKQLEKIKKETVPKKENIVKGKPFSGRAYSLQ